MVLQIGHSAPLITSTPMLATTAVANAQGPHIEAGPTRQTDEGSIVAGVFAKVIEIPTPPQKSWNPLQLFARRKVTSYGIKDWSLEGLIFNVQKILGLDEIEYSFERIDKLDELGAKHAGRYNLEEYVEELLDTAYNYASIPQRALFTKIGFIKLPNGETFDPSKTERYLYRYIAAGLLEQAITVCKNGKLDNGLWPTIRIMLCLLQVEVCMDRELDRLIGPCPAATT